MKILIDGRFYGLENAGIGRYVINLIQNLVLLDKENEYFILLRKKYFEELELPLNFQKIKADFRHYTLIEQIKLPKIIEKIKPDFCHFPHFNVPYFYSGKFIVTIHDLIKHSWKGSETTTHQKFLYWLKYLGYLVIFNKAIKSSSKIIVPSKKVKDEIIDNFKISEDKVSVLYEGVESKWFERPKEGNSVLGKYSIKSPFIIYTGSVYPHKNIDRLIESLKLINERRTKENKELVELVISSSRNVFLQKLEEKIKSLDLIKFVKTIGFATDEELKNLYQFAEAFVFPSLSEGFGLPGLEAMASGCPVVCSDTPIFREIYDNSAIFFNAEDKNDIEDKISEIIGNKELQKELSLKGLNLAKKYSWSKMTEETLALYSELN